MQIRCNFPDISYLSETQKNNFQFLSKAFAIGDHAATENLNQFRPLNLLETTRHVVRKLDFVVCHCYSLSGDYSIYTSLRQNFNILASRCS